ncbi:protein of unassigned function [Methylobacterium oryzae CBMB20]|uniref:Protein of unassigned function n=1 Tax=Methylobacterium oryzae CBMB20 TaxID=693986 RepID=A0A089NRL5_9HYPH|nr:protein of unassigned function [Methylobacterium oryzae CBMB20]
MPDLKDPARRARALDSHRLCPKAGTTFRDDAEAGLPGR